VDDGAMALVVNRLREIGGGIVVADERGVLAELALPVAGLLSDRPLPEVLAASRALNAAGRSLGITLPAPFQSLAFLSLSAIPSLKLTDRGLVDVDRRAIVPLELDAARVEAAGAAAPA
jgi:adenine deaminase